MLDKSNKPSANYIVQSIDPTTLYQGDYLKNTIESFDTIKQAIDYLNQRDNIRRVETIWDQVFAKPNIPYEWAHIGNDSIRYIILPNPEKDV